MPRPRDPTSVSRGTNPSTRLRNSAKFLFLSFVRLLVSTRNLRLCDVFKLFRGGARLRFMVLAIKVGIYLTIVNPRRNNIYAVNVKGRLRTRIWNFYNKAMLLLRIERIMVRRVNRICTSNTRPTPAQIQFSIKVPLLRRRTKQFCALLNKVFGRLRAKRSEHRVYHRQAYGNNGYGIRLEVLSDSLPILSDSTYDISSWTY